MWRWERENKYLTYNFKNFSRNRITINIVLIFVLLSIVFITIWIRAFIGSMNNFSKGKEFFRDKQYLMAITFFDRSMHWYTPFNPYIERSAKYLWQIGKKAEYEGDEKLSLIAIESIRNSFYSARSFYSPGIYWINRCEKKIYQINNQKKPISGVNDSGNENIINPPRMEYNDPSIFWTIIMEIGLFGWIGSMISFTIFGLGSNKEHRSVTRSYCLWALMIGAFYSVWIMGMINAWWKQKIPAETSGIETFRTCSIYEGFNHENKMKSLCPGQN